MNKATENTIAGDDQNYRSDLIKVLLPYGLALLAQLPLLVLYFRRLWNLPHYQPFAIAILATARTGDISMALWETATLFSQSGKRHYFTFGNDRCFFRDAFCRTMVCCVKCDANCDQFFWHGHWTGKQADHFGPAACHSMFI